LIPESEDWSRRVHTAIKLLNARGKARAAELLSKTGLELYKGENDFGDDFHILFRHVTLEEYILFEEYSSSVADKAAFRDIAKTITELGVYIRFIAVRLNQSETPEPVSHPQLKLTSQVVERALLDVENLIRGSGATSAVDRVHTALHGYVRQICSDGGLLGLSPDPTLPECVKLLREKHPKFSGTIPHASHAMKVLRAAGSIVDALGPLRNHSSVAHPNPILLEEPEAMLVVNAARTILHYIESRLQATS
jgi:hypothetical protein